MIKAALFLSFLSIITLVFAVGKDTYDNYTGCIITDSAAKPGFHGAVYYYPWKQYNASANLYISDIVTYKTSKYLSGGYTGGGRIVAKDHNNFTSPGTIANDITATAFEFSFVPPCSSGNCNPEVWADLPHFINSDGSSIEIPYQNCAFHVNGYINPQIDGDYIANLQDIDDLGIINIGNSGFKSPNCCDNYESDGAVDGSNLVESIWTPSGPSGVNQIKVSLRAGTAYPIDIFYVNRANIDSMKFSITDPNGVEHVDLSDLVFHLDSTSKCDYFQEIITTLPWDHSTTSTTTTHSTTTFVQTNTHFTSNPITYTGNANIEYVTVYVRANFTTT